MTSAAAAAAKVLTGATGTRVAARTERKSACLANMVMVGAGFVFAGGGRGGRRCEGAFNWVDVE